jgi:PEP-CTERM motif
MRHLLWMAAPLALLCAAQPSNAQIVYEFANSSGVAQTSFSMGTNSTLAIQVFIHELTAGAPTLNSQGGLGSGAVRVRFNNPAGIAAVLTTADVTPAVPPFAFAGTPQFGSGANANTVSLADGALSTGVLPDAQGRVLLGTFVFHSNAATGSTTLAAVDPTSSAFDTSSFNSTGGFPNIDYDPLLVAGSATLTVTGVPEPTSLVLAGLAAVGMALRRRRSARQAIAVAI